MLAVVKAAEGATGTREGILVVYDFGEGAIFPVVEAFAVRGIGRGSYGFTMEIDAVAVGRDLRKEGEAGEFDIAGWNGGDAFLCEGLQLAIGVAEHEVREGGIEACHGDWASIGNGGATKVARTVASFHEQTGACDYSDQLAILVAHEGTIAGIIQRDEGEVVRIRIASRGIELEEGSAIDKACLAVEERGEGTVFVEDTVVLSDVVDASQAINERGGADQVCAKQLGESGFSIRKRADTRLVDKLGIGSERSQQREGKGHEGSGDRWECFGQVH